MAVRRDGNALIAVLGSEYGDVRQEREVDMVVVEHGTLPQDELYEALKPGSSNGGAVDHPALLGGRKQTMGGATRAGRINWFRIGDVGRQPQHPCCRGSTPLRLAKDL